MSTARAALYFVGLVLIALAVFSVGRQIEANEMLEWRGPAFMGVMGLSAIALGIFSDIESKRNLQNNDPRADGNGDLDLDGD